MKNVRVQTLERKRVPLVTNDFVELSRNTNPEDWSKLEKKDFIRSLESVSFSEYPDLSLLETRISHFTGKDTSDIHITSGVDGAIRDVLDTFCSPGDNILFLTPCYMMYRIYAKAYMLSAIEVHCNLNLEYNFQELLTNLKSKQIRVLFLTNPHSPVDFNLSLTEFEELLVLAEKSNTIVFVDEAYHHFGCQSFIDFTEKYNNLIIARTFSKAFGLPSIRLGFMCASRRISDYLSARRLAYETDAFTAALGVLVIENFKKTEGKIKKLMQVRDYIKKSLITKGYFVHGNQSNSLVVGGFIEGSANSQMKTLLEHKIRTKCLPNELGCYLCFSIGPREVMDTVLEHFPENK